MLRTISKALEIRVRVPVALLDTVTLDRSVMDRSKGNIGGQTITILMECTLEYASISLDKSRFSVVVLKSIRCLAVLSVLPCLRLK